MIVEKIPITLTLAILAFLVIMVTSIPLGIYTAKHQNGKMDRIIYIINQIVMSVPPFFMGIILTLTLGLGLKLFTPGGYVSYTENVGEFIGYLIVPAIAIGIPKSSMAIKLLRSSVIEQIKLDYTRTAFSKGNTINGVLYQHILKNALIPVITFWGMCFADMIAGSIIIEQVFSIPGLGRILLTSISNRDYPVVEAIIIFIAFLVIATNFIVDIIYHKVDPRISTDS
jgi:ABC-type dipeptide/oligopeptide/nickel transport system permease component